MNEETPAAGVATPALPTMEDLGALLADPEVMAEVDRFCRNLARRRQLDADEVRSTVLSTIAVNWLSIPVAGRARSDCQDHSPRGRLRHLLVWSRGRVSREVRAEHRLSQARAQMADELATLGEVVEAPADHHSLPPRDVLVGILTSLPEDQMQVALARLEGFSLGQIAERMGTTRDCVRGLWRRASGTIREAWPD